MAFIEIVKQPLYGSVYWNDIKFVYTPNNGYNGNDSFIYKKIDQGNTLLYTKYVNNSNLPPIANNIELSANASSSIVLNINDISVDDTNPFGEFQIINIENQINGTATTDGQYIYYTAPQFNCVDNIIFTVSDKQYTSTGTISISVLNAQQAQNYKGPFEIRLNTASILTDSVRILSGNYVNSYDFLSSNKDYLNSIDPSLWISMDTFTRATSADLNDLFAKTDEFTQLYNCLSLNSDYWIKDLNIRDAINGNTEKWNLMYDNIAYNSPYLNANLDNLFNLGQSIDNIKETLINLFYTVSVNSISWETTDTNSVLSEENVTFWNDSYSIIKAYSFVWDIIYNLTNTFSGFFIANEILLNAFNNTITSNYTEWNDLLSGFRNDLKSNSGNWQDIYNKKEDYDNFVLSTDPDWATDTNTAIQIYNLISLSASKFNSISDVLNNNYIKWNNAIPLSSEVSPGFPDINNLYNTTSSTSAIWKAHLIRSVLSNSNNLDNTFNILSSYYVTDLNSLFDRTTSFYVEYNKNKINYNTLNAEAFNLITFYKDSVQTLIQSNSSNWNTLYQSIDNYNNLTNVISSLSSNWISNVQLSNAIRDFIVSKSQKWNNVTSILFDYSDKWTNTASLSTQITKNIDPLNSIVTTVSSTSAKWNSISVYNTLSSNNTKWDYTKDNINENQLQWDNVYNTTTSFSSRFILDKSNYNSYTSAILSNYINWDKNPTLMLQSNSSNWNNMYDYSLNYDSMNNIVKENSGNWNSNYNLVKTKYANWFRNPNSVLQSNSGNWNDIYNNISLYDNSCTITKENSALKWNTGSTLPKLSASLNKLSGGWDNYTNYTYLCNIGLDNSVSQTQSISTYVYTNKPNFDSYLTTVSLNSSNWDATIIQSVYNDSGYKWDATYEVLFNDNYNYDWSDTYTLENTFSSNYLSGIYTINSASSTISANYYAWGDRTTNDILTSYSDNWSLVGNTLSTLSSGWVFDEKSIYISSYAKTSALSTNLINFNSLLTSASTSWDNTYLIPSLSLGYNMLTGSDTSHLSSRNLKINKNSIFYNDLSALGGIVRFNTNLIRLSSFIIYNEYTNDALSITKTTGSFNAISNFISLSSSVLYIKTETKTVGVNVSGNDVVQELTVNGDISATGYFDPLFRSTQTNYRTYSANYENVSTYLKSNSGLVDDYISNKPLYDSVYTYVQTNSADFYKMKDKTYYNNFYNTVRSESAIDKNVNEFISLCSSTFSVDTFFRNASGKYDNLFNYVNTTSSSTLPEYIVSHTFYPKPNMVNQYGVYYIQSDSRVLSWTMYSNTDTSAEIDVLSSYYTNSTRLTSIRGNNPPHLDIPNPIKNYRNNLSVGDHWDVNLTRNTILRFVLTTNTLASAITINLKLQKR